MIIMMKKLVFLDIDGTIIDVSHGLKEPSIYTKYAIEELMKNGHIVFIASGRFKGNISPSVHALNPSGYIASNGAYIEIHGKELYSKIFDQALYEELKEFCITNNGIFTAETQDHLYTPIINETFKEYLAKWDIEYVPYSDVDDSTYNKCVVSFNDFKTCKRFEERFKDRLDYRVQTADPTGLSYDINLIGSNKGNAVEIILNTFGFDREDTICFCDGTNDLELAKACKYSFAMANGDEELKKISYGIADSAKNDGVYKKLVERGLIKDKDD